LSKGYKTLEEIINHSDLQPDQIYIAKHINELSEKIPRWEMNLLRVIYVQTTFNLKKNDSKLYFFVVGIYIETTGQSISY
jgi:hypothetical protein